MPSAICLEIKMSLGQKTPTQTCHKRQCLLQDLSSSLQPYRGSWLVLNEGRTKTLPGQLDLILVVWAKPIFAGGRAGARWGGGGTVMVGGWEEQGVFKRGQRCFGGSRGGRRVEPGPFSCR